MGLLNRPGLSVVAPRPASRAELEAFHFPRYLDVLERAGRGDMDAEGLHMGLGTPDTPLFAGLYEYASLACGGSIQGAELVLGGQADVAFNPSGGYHHAHAGKAGGFCYLNDVVLACMRLAAAGRKVLYLDLDVHHGDGVQAAFYTRRDVLTMSFHQTGRTLFPGTGFEDEIGAGDGLGYCVNVPLPPGTYDEAYLGAFGAVGMPIIRAYGPDAIVLEMGMDCLAGDPLAQLMLTNNAYADVLHQLAALHKPVVAAGGGGYHVENTVRGWALGWSVLCGQDEEYDPSVGLGGVMLGTSDWRGGLRDRARVPDSRQKAAVDAAIAETVEKVKVNVFGLLGL
jgi:acetoin utilization protein AcuC